MPTCLSTKLKAYLSDSSQALATGISNLDWVGQHLTSNEGTSSVLLQMVGSF
jgi:hypothetical protein